jgi:diguanylate cyclase (GGDEF)-like protein
MLELIDHIVRISAQRDRTAINDALCHALRLLFEPRALTIFRAFPGARQTMVFACAGIDASGCYVRNAYLPDAEYCRPIAADPLLLRGQREASVLAEPLSAGGSRLVFPIVVADRLLYLIDIVVAEDLSPQRRTVLMGLVEYLTNHVALLDYGESDTLTGLPNRKTFDKHLFEVLGRAAVDRHDEASPADNPRRRLGTVGGHHWLAVCDIDHFKSVNDVHGHLIGDEVLVMFAHLMRDTFRYQDQLFRFGGEEFVAVLQPASGAAVRRAFDRFRQAVAAHNFSRVGRITVSIGYSQLMANDTPPAVIERADEALYYIKQNGRNTVGCYDDLVDTGKLVPKGSRTGEIELF